MMGLPLVGPPRLDSKASKSRGRSRRAFARRGPLEALEARSLLSQVFTVLNTSDDANPGSLRWAIGQVNADATDTAASPDQIHFNIPTTDPGYGLTVPGVWSIAPASALPVIDAPCVVDGYTQPGAAPGTSAGAINAVLKIELDGFTGQDFPGLPYGLSFGSGSGVTGGAGGTISGVRGLAIDSFDTEVALGGAGNFVRGCFLGTYASGAMSRVSQVGFGVQIGADGAVVGGTAPADRNLISNSNYGIFSGSNDALVAGNLIGTDPAGTAAVPDYIGIVLLNGSGDTVGGTTPAARNVISGNLLSGIEFLGSSVTGNVVEGNYIGTDATGTKPLGNGTMSVNNAGSGIFFNAGTNNTVGGTSPSAANVISANGIGQKGSTAGIIFFANGTDVGNVVEGNYIGTDATGTKALGNGGNGIRVQGGTGNAFLDNKIAFNGAIGIDLVGGTENSFGVTANSPGGPHTGPNDLQNYPVLTSATEYVLTELTQVVGTLNSDPSSDFLINLYTVSKPDPSGHGQAQVPLGRTIVHTDASGHAAFSFTLVAGSDLGFFTATATRLLGSGSSAQPGSTSEFAADIPVAGPSADVAVTLVSSTSPVTEGGAVSFTFKVANLGPDTATGVTAVDTLPTNLGGATATASLGQSTLVDGKFTDFVSSLPVGGSFTVTVTGEAFTVGTIDNELIAAASETDPVPTNNTATVSIPVVMLRSATETSLSVKPNPSTFGQTVTFNASPGNHSPQGPTGGTITFSVDGVPTATVPLTSDTIVTQVFTFTSSFADFSTSSLAVGSHVITAHYSGDALNSPSDATPVTLVVNPAPAATTTTLVAQPNPSAVGRAVTFTAAVAPTLPVDGPTGSVTFFIDGVGFTSPVVPSADGLTGTATFAISTLAAGPHTSIARYNGDADFATSQSQAIVETVTPATPPRVVEVLRYGFHALPTALAVVFDAALDPARATDVANYRLAGPHGRSIPIVAAAMLGDRAVVLQPKARLNVHWTYTLTIVGTPPHGVAGPTGTSIGFDPVETITVRNLVPTRVPFAVARRAAHPVPTAHAVDAVLASGHPDRTRATAARRHR